MKEMISRRTFLKVAGLGTVSIAAFGLTGCGGGGGGSSKSDPVTTVYRKVDINALLKMNETQVKAEMEKWPHVNNVFFPYTVAKKLQNTSQIDYDFIEMQFSIANKSSDKTVVFERCEDDYDKLEKQLEDSGITSLDELIRAGKTYESKDFQADKAELAVSYGCKVVSDPNNPLKGNKDLTATQLAPNETGIITLAMLVKTGWSSITVKYHPNFGDGAVYTFEVKPEDIEIEK